MPDPVRRRTADDTVLFDPDAVEVTAARPDLADVDVMEAIRLIPRAPVDHTNDAPSYGVLRNDLSPLRGAGRTLHADDASPMAHTETTPDGFRELVFDQPFEITGDPRTERSSETTSAVRALGNTLALGQLPKILAAADSVVGDETYDDAHARWERAYRDSEADSPVATQVGRGAAVLGTVATPAGPLARLGQSASAAGRIGRAAAIGGTMSGAPAFLNSDADTLSARLSDAALPAAEGAGLGAMTAGLGELVRLLGPERMAALSASANESAFPFRTRSAGARTVPFQRLADDLPGGIPATAKTLADTGIARRGEMMLTGEEAGRRAAQVRARSGARIGETRRAMEGLASDLPSLDARAPGMVDPEPLALAYDEIAARNTGVIGAEHIRDAAASMASDMRSAGPMTFEQAQRSKEFMDSLINWRDPAPGRRLPVVQGNRQEVRRALMRSMDDAVGADLGPEALQGYQGARREYQVSKLFDDMAHDSELRETANRVISPSDYAAGGVATLADATSGWRGLAAVVANRLTRGREHSMVAGSLERIADAADRMAARNVGAGPAARALRAAISQGGPAAVAQVITTLGRENPELADAIAAEATTPIADDAPINPYVDDDATPLPVDDEEPIDPYAD